MKKYDKVFNTDTVHLDWEKIYLLPSKGTLHTRLREFQYKILNRILYTNEMLFKMKKFDSPWCYFCGAEQLETSEHFFFYCSKVRVFWDEVTVMLNSQGLLILKTLCLVFLTRQLVTVTVCYLITLYQKVNTLFIVPNLFHGLTYRWLRKWPTS